MKRWWCAQALALSLVAGVASAQIEIHPLPDAAPAVPVPLGGHPLTPADLAGWLDGQLATVARRPDAGAVVAVVANGQVLLTRGYGHAATGAPVDPATTPFALDGAGTLVTWIAAMQQVAAGHLALDAAIGPPRAGALPGEPPVTLRALMTHVAGFAPGAGDCAHAAPGRWPPRTPALIGVPAYSPCDAALTAAVVARASGAAFAPHVEQAVLRPLGIAQGPDGLAITGVGMERALLALLDPENAGDHSILPAAAVRAWLADQRPLAPGLPPLALGWRRIDRNGWPVLAATAGSNAPRTLLAVLPESGTGVFVAVDGHGTGALPRALLDAFLDRYFPARPAVAQPTRATARADGARLAGRYLSSRAPTSGILAPGRLFTQARIDLMANGELVTHGLSGADPAPRRWREVTPFGWQQVDGRDRLGATLDRGQVRWVATSATAPLAVWLPVPAAQSAAWRLPWLVAALLVLAIGTLAWPLAAFLRRRRGVAAAAGAAWAHAAHAAVIAPLACAAAWAWVLWRAAAGDPSATAGLAFAARSTQVLGALALAGLVPLAVQAWRARGVHRIAWLALLLAAASFAWFVLDYRLLA